MMCVTRNGTDEVVRALLAFRNTDAETVHDESDLRRCPVARLLK
jgi:hypothetical protein